MKDNKDNERLRELYITNTTAEWAKDQLEILSETLRNKDSEDWLILEIQRIKEGLFITHSKYVH